MNPKMSAPHQHRQHRRDKPPTSKSTSKSQQPAVAGTSDAHQDFSSKSISRIDQLKEENILSYNYFHVRIQSLVEKLRLLDSAEQVVVLFTGSEIPHSSGKSWCNECNYLEAILSNFMRRAKNLSGYLVRVQVGSRDEWKNYSNPFRTDPSIRLKSIPTLMVWNSGKRLSGPSIFEVDQLVALFDESVVVKPSPQGQVFYNRPNSDRNVSHMKVSPRLRFK